MRSTLLPCVALFLAACATVVDETDGGLAFRAEPGARVDADDESELEGLPLGAIQRAEARRGALSDEVPHDILVQTWQNRRATLSLTGGSSPTWTWLGPHNAGGRVRAILIHPTNPLRIWIGSAGGGIWRTDDGGSTWQPMNNFLSMLGIGSMALDPGDPNHLYAGTGEGFFETPEGTSNTAFLRGAGIFESLDAGATWTRIASTATPDWYFVNRIVVSPANRDVLLAATNTGIFRSIDRAQTWTQTHNVQALDVDFDPNDATKAVAGRADGRAFYSLNGGVTWTQAPLLGSSTRIELAYAASSPGVVYAAVTEATTQMITVWRSPNGGQSYAQQTTTGTSTLGIYLSCLWVDPTNSNNVIWGGQSLLRSTNAGVSSTTMTSGGHSDYHIVVHHPGFNGSTNKRVYCGSDGGVYTRADWQAGSWSSLNTGLGITQLYGAAVHPGTGTIVAGAQDNATVRYNGSLNWTTNLIGGDGTFCCADQTDSTTFYAGYYWFGLRRSTDGAASFNTDIHGNLPTTAADSNFVPYTLLDPNLQTRMLACGRALWRSDNVKTGNPPIWTQIKAPRSCTFFVGGPANAHYLRNLPCNISTAQIAVGNSNLVWVGHNDGEVYKSTNGAAATPTWQLIDGALGALPDRWVSSIAIDKNDNQRVYLALLGYTANNVWRTTDGGTSWQSISGTGAGALPSLPCTWILQHPRVPTWLLVGTDIGLYQSFDDGGSWQLVTGPLEAVSIEQLIFKNDHDLLCVTHGRGVWQARLDVALVQDLGGSCALSTVPLLSATPPVVGSTQTYSMTGAVGGALVFFGLSIGPPVPQAFGPCTLHLDVPNAVAYLAGATSVGGTWNTPLVLPPLVAFIGAQVTAQALVLNAGGPMLASGDLSNGLLSTLGF